MTRSIIRSFPVIGEKVLRFENLAGRVELVPGKGPTVEVEATVRVGELAEGDVKRLIDGIRWVEAPAEDAGMRWGLSFPAGDYPTVRYPVSGEMKTDSDTVRYLGREVRLSNRRGDSTAVRGVRPPRLAAARSACRGRQRGGADRRRVGRFPARVIDEARGHQARPRAGLGRSDIDAR